MQEINTIPTYTYRELCCQIKNDCRRRLIEEINKHRKTSSTLMNRNSSRSHLILTVNLEQNMQDGSTRVSRLNFVDLAGSEKVKKTGATGTRLQKAGKINASISHLGHVMTQLHKKEVRI